MGNLSSSDGSKKENSNEISNCVLHNQLSTTLSSDTTTSKNVDDGHNLQRDSSHRFKNDLKNNGDAEETTVNNTVNYYYDPVDILRDKFGFEYRRVICCCLDCCCCRCIDVIDDNGSSRGSCCNENDTKDDNNETTTTVTTTTKSTTGMVLTRLFHIKSNTMISSKNRIEFIPDGPMFDKISHLCQEISQDKIQKEYSLKFVTIKKSIIIDKNDEEDGRKAEPSPLPPIRALVDQDFYFVDDNDNEDYESDTTCIDNENNKQHETASSLIASSSDCEPEKQHILIIITGKGKSRAGILSIKELIHSGYEYGSTTMHLMEAEKRNMKIILLDPNACGISNGMDTVYQSLNHLLFTKSHNNNSTTTSSDKQKPIYYILAHSAAGGYLIRYFLLLLDGRGSPGSSSDKCPPIPPQQVEEFLDNNLGGIAFSDSTHNIQWTKKHCTLFDLLESSKCLFIRNNTIHSSEFCDDDKKHKPGDVVDTDTDYWWKRRFGNIKTVWAGTIHHGLVCTVACHVIWDFFDETIATQT